MRLLAAALAAVSMVALAAPGGAADGDPPLSVPEADLDAALECGPFAHPDRPPVLLVHGTGTTPEENWSWNYQAVLPGDGWDVCTVRLPHRALQDIQVSSEYVVHAVHRLAARTGGKVAVVGHSQGALQPRWALRWWPSVQAEVDDLIMLAGPNHGTVVADGVCAAGCFPAAQQMRTTSQFMKALNSGDETPGPVSYTSVATRLDELVQPVETTAIEGGTNIVLQDVCPNHVPDHVGIVGDAVVHALVLDALSHPGGADPSRLEAGICNTTFFPPVGEGSQAGMEALRRDSGFELQDAAAVPTEPPLASYAAAAAAPATPTTTRAPEAAPAEAGGSAATLPATGGRSRAPVAVVGVLVALGLRRRAGRTLGRN